LAIGTISVDFGNRTYHIRRGDRLLPGCRNLFVFCWSSLVNIYVGNLSLEATEADIEHAFSEYGDVKTVSIVKDRETGRSRGFGFVEMRDRQAGQNAINGLNLSRIAGRAITVNEARPREDRRGGRR
jgi:RNA recognition motif-containing protein